MAGGIDIRIGIDQHHQTCQRRWFGFIQVYQQWCLAGTIAGIHIEVVIHKEFKISRGRIIAAQEMQECIALFARPAFFHTELQQLFQQAPPV